MRNNIGLDVNASAECAMNNCGFKLLRRRNKKRTRVPARHNPA
jgi:hypothetical protein